MVSCIPVQHTNIGRQPLESGVLGSFHRDRNRSRAGGALYLVYGEGQCYMWW